MLQKKWCIRFLPGKLIYRGKFSSHPGAPDVVLMHIVHCTDDLLHEDCRNHLSWPKIAIPRWCSPKHNGWSSFHMKVSIVGYEYIYIHTHIYILCTVYIIWLYFWTQMKPIWGCKSLQMVVPNIFGRKMDLLWRNIILPAALLGCDVVVWIQKMCRKADSIHWWIIIFQIETTIKWGGQSHFQAHKKSHPSYQVGCSMVFPLYPQYIPRYPHCMEPFGISWG